MTAFSNNKKYNSILKTAKTLFWKHGIRRVTIEEICREAGVSKMTFYKFFINKTDIAKTILENTIRSSMSKFKGIIESEISFSDKMKEIFLLKVKEMDNFSMEFINDIYNDPKADLKSFMEDQQKESMKLIVSFLKDSQQKGFIRSNVRIDFILALSNHTIEMMKNKHLMAQYEQPQDFVLEAMNTLFYGIIETNRT